MAAIGRTERLVSPLKCTREILLNTQQQNMSCSNHNLRDRPEPELKDMSIKGLSAPFTQVIDPDQFRELLAPGSNLPKGLS